MKKLLFSLALITITIAFNSQNLKAQTDQEKSYYVIEQFHVFDELDYAFYQAYNAFLNGEDAKAGARLRRAAYFVRMKAKHAKVYNVKSIEKQANRLESLADSVALGLFNSAWRMRRSFARTHYVLANDYQIRAVQFWAKDKAEDTGHAMVAAAGHLGHAAKWTGKKVEQGIISTGKSIGKGAATAGVESYRGVRWLGGKMIQGMAFVPSKVGQSLEWLGKNMNKVGKGVNPKPRKNIATK